MPLERSYQPVNEGAKTLAAAALLGFSSLGSLGCGAASATLQGEALGAGIDPSCVRPLTAEEEKAMLELERDVKGKEGMINEISGSYAGMPGFKEIKSTCADVGEKCLATMSGADRLVYGEKCDEPDGLQLLATIRRDACTTKDLKCLQRALGISK